MVLEELFNPGMVKHRPYLAFVFGALFTLISYLISMLFFKESMSVAMIFLTTLLLTPTLVMLLKMEEQREGKYGLKHFFRNHADIFEAYLFSFLGIFAVFVMLGLAMYNDPATYAQLFDFQINFLSTQEGLSANSVQSFVDGTRDISLDQIVSIFTSNLFVVMICFVLSLFYGATAIFLIILNASIFANFIVFVIKTLADNGVQGIQAFFFFMIHLLPEVSGFLIAAIAGGVISKAMIYEKKGSVRFKNVFKDATLLMLIAVGMVLLSSLLEVLVTSRLFQAFF